LLTLLSNLPFFPPFVKKKRGKVAPPYLAFFFAVFRRFRGLGADLGLGFGLGSSIVGCFANPLSVPTTNPFLI